MEQPSDEKHYEKWKWQSPLGLAAVGLGATLVSDAAIRKANDGPTWIWVIEGTAGLSAVNAGLSLFGDAIKHRVLYEIQSDTAEDGAASVR